MDHTSKKTNASGEAGVGVAGGEAKATKKKISCADDHISKVVNQVVAAGLRLASSSGDTQLATLPKVLQFRGSEGINTYEGVALGYLRIATRVKELKETWDIHTVKEDVFGPDGLWHKNVARYVLVGKRKDVQPAQQSLPLEVRA